MPRFIALLLGSVLVVLSQSAEAEPAPTPEPRVSSNNPFGAWRSLPSLRTTPVTPRTIELARELVTLERGGLSDEAAARRGGAAAARLFGSRPGLLDAMAQATRESPDLVAAMRERHAEVYARNYTDEELGALIAMLSDPVGRKVHQKRLAAIGGQPASFTQQEQAWIREVENGPMGRALTAKKPKVSMVGVFASMEFTDRISKRAVVIYCATNVCSDETKRRLAADP